ncbi:hypothetical protein F0919_05030 [Taibaiella lutea]|uniref:Uncharacterized protein n=1 Tax=Taibaiella lutea TaxID=2608001 RepID=A0A5M6CV19_9BACT|nr:hypothetical protein [Taibaiella lutea]KAA5537039.1 hypothetical protein F0919_05030 [Taibaiella lutea]
MINTLGSFKVYQSIVAKTLNDKKNLKIKKPSIELSLKDMIEKRKALAKKNDELQQRMRDSISETKKLLKK